jgi:enterochelin esterase-like enzyme
MKSVKIIFVLVLFCFISLLAYSNDSKIPLKESIVENLVFHSDLLNKDMKINVYLPKGYTENIKYSVLYFLHGFGKTQEILFESGTNITADKLLEEKKIEPMIIVFPQIDNSFGLNSSGKYMRVEGFPIDLGMYEDYICKEIITYIETKYSTINNRAGRFIGGASMGGFASLLIGFKHIDLYSKIGGHMPYINQKTNYSMLKKIFKDEKKVNENDPFMISDAGTLKNLEVYLDSGDNDKYRSYNDCKILYEILTKNGVKAYNNIYNGDHSTKYIKANMDKYLIFYSPGKQEMN